MTCRIINALSEISDQYDAVFCDLWGCYHNGVQPYGAAVEACRTFRERGGLVILLTNAPRPAPSVKAFLDRIGGPEDSYDAIVSSGEACRVALTSGGFGARFHYVGPDRDLHMLTDIGLAPAPLDSSDAILITGLRDDTTERPEDYDADIALWRDRGLPMLCANPDIIVDRGEQRLWCAGAIAQRYEQAGGTVTWFGKPHYPVYARCHEVLDQLAGREIPKSRVLAIGDGIGTDVKGGIDAGLDMLFVSGGLAAGEIGPDVETPRQAGLDAYLATHHLAPQFAIGRLR